MHRWLSFSAGSCFYVTDVFLFSPIGGVIYTYFSCHLTCDFTSDEMRLLTSYTYVDLKPDTPN